MSCVLGGKENMKNVKEKMDLIRAYHIYQYAIDADKICGKNIKKQMEEVKSNP